jgi:tetratricopeptide (TPR) repeat protein
MRKSSRAATALLAALAILAAPVAVRTARADDTAEARQHYGKGKQLFDAGDYRGAMAEFATADKLAPSPLLEFNIALCHERLGEKAEAVRRYRQYLDRVPDAQNRTQVEQKIHQLESEMKADSAPPPPATVPPPSTGPAEQAPPPAAEAAPAPTGDQDLDRVNRIDIGKVRSQREAAADDGGGGSAAEAAPAPEGEANRSAPPPRDDGGNKSKPIYKQWWFWVVAGVSAIILIDIATSGSDDGDSSRALQLMPAPGARGTDATGGAVLWRF